MADPKLDSIQKAVENIYKSPCIVEKYGSRYVITVPRNKIYELKYMDKIANALAALDVPDFVLNCPR